MILLPGSNVNLNGDFVDHSLPGVNLMDPILPHYGPDVDINTLGLP